MCEGRIFRLCIGSLGGLGEGELNDNFVEGNGVEWKC